MVASGIIKIVGLIVLGAILADVLRNPRGTSVLVGGVSDLFKTGLQGASGQNIGSGGGKRHGR